VPALSELRTRIAAGAFGDIYQLSCMQWDAEPPTAEFAASSGGIVIDMGVHELDQIRWLTGQEIVGVEAVTAGPPAVDSECAVVLVRLSGGAAAIVSLGRRFPFADSCWLELWGTDGYERLPFMWDADVWSEAGAGVFDAAMLAQVDAFARAVRGEPREGAGGEDAVAALTAAERATEALASAPV
jgi:myo-inositol 2-dehydrogenase/D-chiro-inositol 1-dehydrogenase